MINYKVVIGGVCRDVENQLPATMHIMESIGKMFQDYHIVVVENDSLDRTPQILHEWADKNSRVSAICLKYEKIISFCTTEDGSIFRPERIAHARNILLDYIFDPQDGISHLMKDFLHVIMMDMDFVREPDYEGFIETFSSSREWDAVFANGIDPNDEYWDWYALRDKNFPLGPEVIGQSWWSLPRNKVNYIDRKADWYPVYSAFGGCGIYKKDILNKCRYEAYLKPHLSPDRIVRGFYQAIIQKNMDSEMVRSLLKDGPDWKFQLSTKVINVPVMCEHTMFHACMHEHGKNKMFINPRLIFRYGM